MKTKVASGDDLLSHGETPHYHRRDCVSLLSSGWDQVGPQCYCHQTYSYWLIVRLTVLFPRYAAHVLQYTARLARHGFVSQTITCVINLCSSIQKAVALKYGGRYWDRTSDPLLVREVLSRLS